MIYASDFETTTDKEDCRVWAWASTTVDSKLTSVVGTDIDSFMSFMREHGNIHYFHNLKFDGTFIMYWLFGNGYKHVKQSRDPLTKRLIPLEPGEFTSLISSLGVWYSITIAFKPDERGNTPTIEIRDSSKLIALAIEEFPKTFGFEDHKLTIDYKEKREIGHKLTEQEREYVIADTVILSKGLQTVFSQGDTKLTAGSCAMADCKARIGIKQYKKWFPILSRIEDKDIRLTYKGGWTFLNPKYKNADIGEGLVLDINSMYPWAMRNCLLPYGEPIFFKGKPNPSKIYPLYAITLECTFKLKQGHYPSIQLKNSSMFNDTEYIEEAKDPIILNLTSVDLELLFFNYDVEVYEWLEGYYFRGKLGMFDDYVDYWYDKKQEADKLHNKGLKFSAKLKLNSLYGKFGSRITGRSKIPFINDEGLLKFNRSDKEERKPAYLPVATFITSYCRDKINRGAYLCGDRFVYADTDSLHIRGTEAPDGLEIDPYKLGAFKIEAEFKRARFIRQKTYLECIDAVDINGNTIEKIDIKCAGMPRKMKETITEDEFYEGAVFDPSDGKHAPKLVPRIVPGGVILAETTFKIKKVVTGDSSTKILDKHKIIDKS